MYYSNVISETIAHKIYCYQQAIFARSSHLWINILLSIFVVQEVLHIIILNFQMKPHHTNYTCLLPVLCRLFYCLQLHCIVVYYFVYSILPITMLFDIIRSFYCSSIQLYTRLYLVSVRFRFLYKMWWSIILTLLRFQFIVLVD